MTRTNLDGMNQAIWNRLSPADKNRLRDESMLSPQLIGLEGWRVEVTTHYGETRRFIVGRSTGWQPIHIELARRNSDGGHAASTTPYLTVRKLYAVR